MGVSTASAPRAALAVRTAGAYASIQDAGRRGHRRIGVPWAGVLDAALMRIANRLVGNDDAAPVIEAFDGGQQFTAVDAALRVALAGDAELEIVAAGERRAVAAWRSHLLQPGDTLRIARTGAGRIVVLAVAGIDVPACLGSAATYARAALGGMHGRALASGDEVPAAACAAGPERVLRAPPSWAGDARTPIRVVLGPQADHFDDEAIARFLAEPWIVSAAADRMGVRLEGAQPLAHRPDKGAEIVSDATVPGSIQVPGAGQPIVLLADAQTAGGYPKIATVVSADLPRLAARRPGETIRFAAVDVAAAERLARARARELDRLLAGIAVLAGEGVDLDALYRSNLVDGVVNALQPDEVSRD